MSGISLSIHLTSSTAFPISMFKLPLNAILCSFLAASFLVTSFGYSHSISGEARGQADQAAPLIDNTSPARANDTSPAQRRGLDNNYERWIWCQKYCNKLPGSTNVPLNYDGWGSNDCWRCYGDPHWGLHRSASTCGFGTDLQLMAILVQMLVVVLFGQLAA